MLNFGAKNTILLKFLVISKSIYKYIVLIWHKPFDVPKIKNGMNQYISVEIIFNLNPNFIKLINIMIT